MFKHSFNDFQRAPVKNIERQWIPVFTGMTKLRRNSELVFSFTRPFLGRVCSWIPALAGMTNLKKTRFQLPFLGLTLFVQWKFFTERFYLSLDFGQTTVVVSVFNGFVNPSGHGFHFFFFHPSGGEGRGSQANA